MNQIARRARRTCSRPSRPPCVRPESAFGLLVPPREALGPRRLASGFRGTGRRRGRRRGRRGRRTGRRRSSSRAVMQWDPTTGPPFRCRLVQRRRTVLRHRSRRPQGVSWKRWPRPTSSSLPAHCACGNGLINGVCAGRRIKSIRVPHLWQVHLLRPGSPPTGPRGSCRSVSRASTSTSLRRRRERKSGGWPRPRSASRGTAPGRPTQSLYAGL